MNDLVINSTVQHTLLLFVPLFFAYLLKQAKLKSWPLLGGLLAGILLGPAVFGSIVPDYWEGLFQGGIHQKEQFVNLKRQQQSDFLAANKIGTSEAVLLQIKADQQYELKQIEDAWLSAQWSDQRTLRNYAIVLIVLIFLSGNVRTKIPGTAPPLMSLSVGVWAAIVPCGLLSLISMFFWESNTPAMLAFGACLAAGPWAIARWEQRAADDSESGGAALMLRCGRVAWTVATIVAIYATWQLRGVMSLVWLLPLLLLPLCWLFHAKKAKWLHLFVDYGAIPSVVATTLVLIHPIESLSLWPIIVVILISADGRWLGGIIGLGLLGGRSNKDALRLSLPLVDAGVSQLCMAALLFGAGVLPPSYALAAIIGAIFLDRTAMIRMKFATSKEVV